MKKRVKITTLELILDVIFPCYCRGCGKIGDGFCSCCFFDNMAKNPPFCSKTDKEFHTIFTCGIRTGILANLVAEYKYQSRRHYVRGLARYLNEVISRFSDGEEYVVVPLPTVSKHIRERGFDHIGRLCREFSVLSGFPVAKLLKRVNSAVQVGVDAKTRLKQAKEAYKIDSKVSFNPKSHFLLVDDVWTTGASMRAARAVLEAELLRRGVKKSEIKISAIVLAKNDGYRF